MPRRNRVNVPLDTKLEDRLRYFRQSLVDQVHRHKNEFRRGELSQKCIELILDPLKADNAIYFVATLQRLVVFFDHFDRTISTNDWAVLKALRIKLRDLKRLTALQTKLMRLESRRNVDIMLLYADIRDKDTLTSRGDEMPFEERVLERVKRVVNQPSKHYERLWHPSDDDPNWEDSAVEMIVDGEPMTIEPGFSKKPDWLCPLTLEPIQIPVRTVLCRHLECFDLRNFVEQVTCRVGKCPDVQEMLYIYPDKRRYMRCPHCRQHFNWSDLAVDWEGWKEMPGYKPSDSAIQPA